MQKFFSVVAGICVMVCLICGGVTRTVAGESVPTRILATTFPVYQLLRNITRGVPGVRIGLMIPAPAGCPHDYALTPQDMRRLSEADILVINGLGLEAFLGAPSARVRPDLKTVDSSKDTGDALRYTDGREPAGSGHGALNPHLFASPRRAARMAAGMGEQLAAQDPAHAALYRKNAQAYAQRLDQLADEFAALGKRLKNTRIVTQHGVFDYLAADMGLTVAAVVQDHETQAPSAADMLRLIKTIRESGAGAIFTEPQYPEKTGTTLARETGIPAARLDPVASGPENAPLEYYENVMRNNMRVLEKTLGTK